MTADSTVYVVDDDDHARESVEALLKESGFSVRAFASPECFLQEVASSACGCLVLDLRMPRIDGCQVQERLLDMGSGLPTIVLTAYGDVPSTVRAMKLGAVDVLEKPCEPRLLVDRVRAACEIGRFDADSSVESAQIRAAICRLSPREREVCALLIRGLTPKEIAYSLKISLRTAQLHRERILDKCRLRNVVELSKRADIIEPELT